MERVMKTFDEFCNESSGNTIDLVIGATIYVWMKNRINGKAEYQGLQLFIEILIKSIKT